MAAGQTSLTAVAPVEGESAAAEDHLYRCSSCDDWARQRTRAPAPCEFCGGELRPLWGLGQLPPARSFGNTTPDDHGDERRSFRGDR